MNFYLVFSKIHSIFAGSLIQTIMILSKEHVHSYLSPRTYSGGSDSYRNRLLYGQLKNKEMKLRI